MPSRRRDSWPARLRRDRERRHCRNARTPRGRGWDRRLKLPVVDRRWALSRERREGSVPAAAREHRQGLVWRRGREAGDSDRSGQCSPAEFRFRARHGGIQVGAAEPSWLARRAWAPGRDTRRNGRHRSQTSPRSGFRRSGGLESVSLVALALPSCMHSRVRSVDLGHAGERAIPLHTSRDTGFRGFLILIRRVGQHSAASGSNRGTSHAGRGRTGWGMPKTWRTRSMTARPER